MTLPCNYIFTKENAIRAFGMIENRFIVTGEKYLLYRMNGKLQFHPEKYKTELKMIYPQAEFIEK